METERMTGHMTHGWGGISEMRRWGTSRQGMEAAGERWKQRRWVREEDEKLRYQQSEWGNEDRDDLGAAVNER